LDSHINTAAVKEQMFEFASLSHTQKINGVLDNYINHAACMSRTSLDFRMRRLWVDIATS
jgi:hypothetical protein